jgi:hypothetical protein
MSKPILSTVVGRDEKEFSAHVPGRNYTGGGSVFCEFNNNRRAVICLQSASPSIIAQLEADAGPDA